MSSRLRYKEVAPEAYRALSALQVNVGQSGLDAKLVELVYLRVSQINGCAFCVHRHSKSLRVAGESERRLDTLVVWREAPFFTARERVALDWAESVTRLGSDHVSDALYESTRLEFGDNDLVNLTLAVATINAWNRMAIAFRSEPVNASPIPA
jgi:AhpD family alkylhydroperoxidase